MINENFAVNANYYVKDGLDGGVRIDVKTTNIIVYRIPRNFSEALLDEYDMKQPGIYMLVNQDNRTLYVGQADARDNGNGILARILESHSNEDWQFAFAIVSSDRHFLGATELNYWEQFFYDQAVEVERYTLLNGIRPHSATVSSGVRMTLNKCSDYVFYLIRHQFNCDVFVKQQNIVSAPAGVLTESDGGQNSGETSTQEELISAINKMFHLKAYQEATAIFLNAASGGQHLRVNVKVGLAIKSENKLPNQAGQESSARLRAKLIADGIIVNNVFVQNYVFNTPSQAASIILGRSANGNTEWIDENGTEFDKYPEAFHKDKRTPAS